MRIRTGCRAAAMSGVIGVVAAFLVSCTSVSSGGGPGDGIPEIAASEAAVTKEPTPAAEPDGAAQEPMASPGPAAVRDAFAGVQATLNETCTPGAGDCAYFLGRVNTELQELDEAMRADAKGPGHFKEPLAWTGTLWKTLDGDTSTENLETHRNELLDTRDRINTWMQGHPDDYR
ncbi:hypothetical protein [Streptomyces sp. NPDC055749]